MEFSLEHVPAPWVTLWPADSSSADEGLRIEKLQALAVISHTVLKSYISNHTLKSSLTCFAYSLLLVEVGQKSAQNESL